MIRFCFAFLFLFILNIEFAYAYNSTKCHRLIRENVMYGYAFSTTSYFTSTGECSAIGMIDQQKQFLAVNDELLMIDSAKGQGEYLSAYASLSGCNELGKILMGKTLQQNFQIIWGNSFDGDTDKVHTRINNILLNDPVLSKECKANHAG